jgi:catechol 2,3-dioxygenase-like lactoylglutathione lyase family enzyme
MLRESEAFSGFAVDDIEAAKKFYGETLGLDVAEEHGQLTLKLGGGTKVFVYPRPGFVPASYTILNFPVDDIDLAVDELARRGVTIERFEGIEQDDKGIVRPEKPEYGPPIAWFKDPAGNILSVLAL